jgi:hypothetical protein
MRKTFLQTMDFNEWLRLAQQDPETFESARLDMIDEVIKSAPEEQRAKLRCLQWRIDQVRRRSNTPLGACISLSHMMWERVVGDEGLLEHIGRLQGCRGPYVVDRAPRRCSAKVIPLHPEGWHKSLPKA